MEGVAGPAQRVAIRTTLGRYDGLDRLAEVVKRKSDAGDGRDEDFLLVRRVEGSVDERGTKSSLLTLAWRREQAQTTHSCTRAP